jgi:hypothetical protein
MTRPLDCAFKRRDDAVLSGVRLVRYGEPRTPVEMQAMSRNRS